MMLLKTLYNKFVTKAIGTSEFDLKTQYNTDKSGLEKKIDDASKKTPNAGWHDKKTIYNDKITESQRKIPSNR